MSCLNFREAWDDDGNSQYSCGLVSRHLPGNRGFLEDARALAMLLDVEELLCRAAIFQAGAGGDVQPKAIWEERSAIWVV